MRAMPGRAGRVAAPGARRVTLTGVMAVPDDFNRARLLILGERPDGAPDGSWARLRAACVDCEPRAGEPRAGEPRGVVCLVLPAHRRAHWLGVAEALRGQWVTVEATVRPYKRGERGGHGNALDLAMLSAAPQ